MIHIGTVVALVPTLAILIIGAYEHNIGFIVVGCLLLGNAIWFEIRTKNYNREPLGGKG